MRKFIKALIRSILNNLGRLISMKLKKTILKTFLFFSIILHISCDLESLSEPETKEIKPPSINGVSISKSSIRIGEIVNCSVDASDPQGNPLTYMWYVEFIDGENYVEGAFLGSRESRQVSWQANKIWNSYSSKNYGKVQICIDVGNFENFTHAYRFLTVYP
jgi:hypothetical protein